jgi:hypothetical protein
MCLIISDHISYCVLGSVTITTEVVTMNPVHGELYSMQHYVITFGSDLLLVSGFLRVLWSSTNQTDHHDITEILLKVALNTINQTKPGISEYISFCVLESVITSI